MFEDDLLTTTVLFNYWIQIQTPSYNCSLTFGTSRNLVNWFTLYLLTSELSLERLTFRFQFTCQWCEIIIITFQLWLIRDNLFYNNKDIYINSHNLFIIIINNYLI